MRRFAALALGMVLALCIQLIGGQVDTEAAGRSKPCVDRYGDGRCKVKPGRWGAGAHAEVRSLDWKHWGNKHAVGKGRIHYAPGGDGGPGVIKLSKRRKCGDAQDRYTKIKIVFVDMPSYSYGYRSGC